MDTINNKFYLDNLKNIIYYYNYLHNIFFLLKLQNYNHLNINQHSIFYHLKFNKDKWHYKYKMNYQMNIQMVLNNFLHTIFLIHINKFNILKYFYNINSVMLINYKYKYYYYQ